MLKNMNSNLPITYPYGYYPQANCYYQRQAPQRKRGRTVSGEEANEYRIIP